MNSTIFSALPSGWHHLGLLDLGIFDFDRAGINGFAESVSGFAGSLLMVQLWQVTLAIAIVASINVFVRRQRPHLATLLWLVVLVKCVTPPVWCSTSSVFSWIQPRQVSKVLDEPRNENPIVNSEARLPQQFYFLPVQRTNQHENERLDKEAPNLVGTAEPLSFSSTNGPRRSENLTQFVGAHEGPNSIEASEFNFLAGLAMWSTKIWLFGFLVALLFAVIRFSVFWTRIQFGSSRDRRLEVVARRIARKLNVRQQINVRVTRQKIGPAIIGIFFPMIILPEIIVRKTTSKQIEPILAHEINHLRRGDILFSGLQLLVTCCWWFHPLVWMINRIITRDIERCCDESTIARLDYSPAKYAHCLLDVLQMKQLKPVPSFPGVRRIDITKNRLERIMNLRQGSRLSPRSSASKSAPVKYWVIAIFVALVTIPGGRFVAQEKADQENTKNSKAQTVSNSKQDPDKRQGSNIATRTTNNDKKSSDDAPTKTVTLPLSNIPLIDTGNVTVPDGGTFLSGVKLKMGAKYPAPANSDTPTQTQDSPKTKTPLVGSNMPMIMSTPYIVIQEEEEKTIVVPNTDEKITKTYNIASVMNIYRRSLDLAEGSKSNRSFDLLCRSLFAQDTARNQLYRKVGNKYQKVATKSPYDLSIRDAELTFSGNPTQHGKLASALSAWETRGFDDVFDVDAVMLSTTRAMAKLLGAVQETEPSTGARSIGMPKHLYSTNRVISNKDEMANLCDVVLDSKSTEIQFAPRLKTRMISIAEINTDMDMQMPVAKVRIGSDTYYQLRNNGRSLTIRVVPQKGSDDWVIEYRYWHSWTDKIRTVGHTENEDTAPTLFSKGLSSGVGLKEGQLLVVGTEAPKNAGHEYDVLLISYRKASESKDEVDASTPKKPFTNKPMTSSAIERLRASFSTSERKTQVFRMGVRPSKKQTQAYKNAIERHCKDWRDELNTVVYDETSNSLIVCASPEKFKAFEESLKDLWVKLEKLLTEEADGNTQPSKSDKKSVSDRLETKAYYVGDLIDLLCKQIENAFQKPTDQQVFDQLVRDWRSEKSTAERFGVSERELKSMNISFNSKTRSLVASVSPQGNKFVKYKLSDLKTQLAFELRCKVRWFKLKDPNRLKSEDFGHVLNQEEIDRFETLTKNKEEVDADIFNSRESSFLSSELGAGSAVNVTTGFSKVCLNINEFGGPRPDEIKLTATWTCGMKAKVHEFEIGRQATVLFDASEINKGQPGKHIVKMTFEVEFDKEAYETYSQLDKQFPAKPFYLHEEIPFKRVR